MTTQVIQGSSHQKPWLSIMIPAHNVAPYVEECLRSILDQAGTDIQIIVCDDCSTDDTKAIVEAIAAANPGRLTMFQNPRNLGLSATRNAMIAHATGEYFWFIDSDDSIRPGAIAAIRQTVETYQPDIVSGDYHKKRIRKFALHGLWQRHLRPNADILSAICEARKMYIWLKISHHGLWDDGLRFPEGRSFEDAATVPRLALRAKSMVHMRRSLVNYRVRPGSILSAITRTPERFNIERHLDLAHALDGFKEEIDHLEGCDPSVDYGTARRAVSHFIAMEFAKIVQRIARAGPAGCNVSDIHALARRFFDIMNVASPVPFTKLGQIYTRRGQLIASYQLRRALRFIDKRNY